MHTLKFKHSSANTQLQSQALETYSAHSSNWYRSISLAQSSRTVANSAVGSDSRVNSCANERYRDDIIFWIVSEYHRIQCQKTLQKLYLKHIFSGLSKTFHYRKFKIMEKKIAWKNQKKYINIKYWGSTDYGFVFSQGMLWSLAPLIYSFLLLFNTYPYWIKDGIDNKRALQLSPSNGIFKKTFYLFLNVHKTFLSFFR